MNHIDDLIEQMDKKGLITFARTNNMKAVVDFLEVLGTKEYRPNRVILTVSTLLDSNYLPFQIVGTRFNQLDFCQDYETSPDWWRLRNYLARN